MKRILSLLIIPIILITLTGMAEAAETVGYQQVAVSKKPSNPCAVNPCNPCAGKNPCAANPCNPCAVKNPCMMKNPCTPGNVCNPCAVVNPPLRKMGFKNHEKAVKVGKKLWNDPKLGTSGLSCNSCHANGTQLNLGTAGPFPHYVAMPNDVVTLDQMINYCMINPMKAKPLPWDSREMTAIAAYYQHMVKQHEKGTLNPCAVKNPCGANPCNPCAAKNPCAGKNPCRGW